MNFTKYLGIAHDYGNMNCVLFIEKIYKDTFNITFPRDRYNLNDVDGIKALRKVDPDYVFSIEQWKRINLTDLECFDILIFKDEKYGRLKHFGLYVGNNKFIHLPVKSVSVISDLNEKYRQVFSGAVRHDSVDSELYRNPVQT